MVTTEGKLKLDPCLTPHTKVNSKTLRSDQKLKYIEENTGRTDQNLDLKGAFSDLIPVAKATTYNMNKWDYIKLKSFCMATTTTG